MRDISRTRGKLWRLTFPARFVIACFIALLWLIGLGLGLWDV